MKTYAFRLKPGQDLKRELVAFTAAKGIQSGFILTCVGSVRQAALRLANKPDTTMYEGKREIVSLTGTLCPDGPHLHISLSDGEGVTIGGHLQDGNLIYTTAEVVIGELEDVIFCRELCSESTYDELVVKSRP